MSRLVSALAAVLLFAAPGAADDAKITIRWHGQSFFEVISPAGVRIVIDPHTLEEYPRKQVSADLVLISHFHVDHSRTEYIENIKKAKQINALTKEDREGRIINYTPVDEQLKDVHVQMLGTYHDNMGGMQRGKNGVFILDVAGVRIVHLGDLGHLLSRRQVDKLGKVDVLMIPVGGVYTLNGLDAQKVVEQIKPRRVILPMHYGTTVYPDLLDLKYFLEDQKMGKVTRSPTNELVLEAKGEVPKEPQIVILHWAGKGDKLEK
jgi:L-ascorbate metabolism protein UlaG (beta-lactamase superfamily)